MTKLLKQLCLLNGTSGDECGVRDFIISEIKNHCEFKIDNLGNIIAFKKGKNRPAKKVMLDAHMDEVGLIITSITPDGFLKFKTVGGIMPTSLMLRKVKIGENLNGAISGKPIHLLKGDEAKKSPPEDSLYIDIGATSKEDAEKFVSVGDRGVICGDFIENEDTVISKAIDDRIGCAVLIELIKNYNEYDFYATFTVQEEIGLRGAKVASFSVNPDSAIVIEGATASDIAGVPEEKTVCKLGGGPVVSFMDGATVYDRKYYKAALQSGIKCQPKSAVTGGNNAGAIHLNREGIRTVAISVPSRYIHSESTVANKEDFKNLYRLAEFMLSGIASGEIE